MTTRKHLIAAGLALLCLGCPTRSLFPLFTEKDLVSDPAIVGTWGDPKGDLYTFQNTGKGEYNVVCTDKDGAATLYKVQLGKLGKWSFLDSYPGRKGDDHHLISAHIISRISLDGDSLRIASLESEWLRQMIDGDNLTIGHVKIDGDIILTAPTEDLQGLALHFAADERAFPRSLALARMK